MAKSKTKGKCEKCGAQPYAGHVILVDGKWVCENLMHCTNRRRKLGLL